MFVALPSACRRLLWVAICGWYALTFSGCATHAKKLQAPRNAFYANDLEQSHQLLQKLASSRKDKDCVELDLAIVDLTRGDAASAENRLRKVRDRFDHLEQDSLAEKATSYWTDDRARSYAGDEYERILLRAFLAISSLMQDGVDAESYSLQMDEKQRDIYEAAAERLGPEKMATYPVVPLGFYLRGVLREATFHDYDEAAANYRQVCNVYPDTPMYLWDLKRAQQGVHSSPGNGVVYIIAMIGHGPRKVAVTEEPTSDALLVADRIISAVGPYSLPPTIAPIQVPAIEVSRSGIDSLFVSVDQARLGRTEIIADIEGMAVQTYELNHDEILGRAVARRVIKKATVLAAKDSMQVDPLVSFAMDAAGVAWEATEAADTRCWGLLPASIQVMRVEMPAGKHRVTLQPMHLNRTIGIPQAIELDVQNARNTYVLGYFPDDRLIGRISVSR